MSLLDKASIVWPKGAPSKAGFVANWNPQTGALVNFPVTRATTKKYIDEAGEWAEAAANVLPRDFTNGGCGVWAIEPARKNLFLNSTTGVTQSITVVSGRDYAVSFSGTGSITFSGGATGTLSGTGAGATDRVSVIKTTTTTSVTCTISGTVEYVNFEINTNDSSVTYSTRWIETAGSIVTRNADVPALTGAGALLGQASGGIFLNFTPYEKATSLLRLSDGGINNRVDIGFSSVTFRMAVVVSGVNQTFENSGTYNAGDNYKIGLRYATNDFKTYVNGVSTLTDTSGNTFSGSTLNEVSFQQLFGDLKELVIFNQAPTDTQLAAITTP